jgi:hypothetical protein
VGEKDSIKQINHSAVQQHILEQTLVHSCMRGDVSKSSPPKPGFSSLCERCRDGRAQEGATVKAAKTESSKRATGGDCIIRSTLTTKQQRCDHVDIILSMQFVLIALSG